MVSQPSCQVSSHGSLNIRQVKVVACVFDEQSTCTHHNSVLLKLDSCLRLSNSMCMTWEYARSLPGLLNAQLNTRSSSGPILSYFTPTLAANDNLAFHDHPSFSEESVSTAAPVGSRPPILHGSQRQLCFAEQGYKSASTLTSDSC